MELIELCITCMMHAGELIKERNAKSYKLQKVENYGIRIPQIVQLYEISKCYETLINPLDPSR